MAAERAIGTLMCGTELNWHLGIGYGEYLVTRMITDISVRGHLRVEKSIKRMMVSGMTETITEVVAMVEESYMDI